MRTKKKGDGRGRRLRVFAWVLALGLALVGWGLFHGSVLGLSLELTAAAVFAIGATWPRAFDWLYRLVSPARKPPLGNPA